ncbi:heavy-metal-associated domain-containing protein [Draconibacterium sp. IB214405]|uniref:heavy-metal-associated domain-containing protein n=1 Tax=Draconibacterium sp. IB214405 TaxID=3097352 RepID=UPI002A0D0FBB|nr:heavy-metal-associated domain-containing protein [Draconibacterium sp. IB214405]MDX8339661.1 heavy-metal-associated domain-containing protein [Draconibacterium sp. IB214405]
MKKLIVLLAVAMFIGFSANETFAQKKENKVVCFKSDMDCSECENTINEYLKFEKGVKDLKVDHASNTIFVEYKDGKNTDEKLAQAIKKKGYKAEKITQEEYEEIIAHTHEAGHEHNHEVHKERK